MHLTFRSSGIGLAGMLMVAAQCAVAQQMPRTIKEEIKGTAAIKTEQISGEVQVVESNKLVVKMSDGDIRYFEPPASRRFLIDGRELTFTQLKPGTKLQATITTTTTPVTERTTTIGTGKVWFVSGNNVIITLPNGENRQYKVDDNYRFNVGGQKATVFDLRKGMVINAEKIVEVPKTEMASNVTVVGQAPPELRPRTEVAQVRTPTPEPRVTPAPAAAPAPAPDPAPAPVAQAAPAPTTLPDTASRLPLIGLAGLLFIGASRAVRKFRRD
jgi:hypothetical protein